MLMERFEPKTSCLLSEMMKDTRKYSQFKLESMNLDIFFLKKTLIDYQN